MSAALLERPSRVADRHPHHVLWVVVAGAALFMVGLDRELIRGATTATVVGLALLPVWAREVARQRALATLSLLTALTVLAGVLLALANASFALRSWDRREAEAAVVLLLTAVFSIGVVVWSRHLIGLGSVAIVYGLGSLASGVLATPGSLNVWKYQLSMPVSIVLLGWCERRRSPRLAMLLLLGLAAVGATRDSRSYAAFAALTFFVVAWQHRPRGRRPLNRLVALVLLVGAGGVAYQLGTSLLVGGYLGPELQARSAAQVAQAGSLIAGGRPEWSATLQLVREHPAGFGLGARPTLGDVTAAKVGMAGVGIPTRNGYIDNYMFGGHIKLHSILADLWAAAGVVGVALAFAMIVICLQGLTRALSDRVPSPLSVFLLLNALWFLFFGPIYSNLKDVAFALAATVPLTMAGARAGDAPGPDSESS